VERRVGIERLFGQSRATAWIDRATSPLPTESVSLFAAFARVLADGICAVQPIPLADCAALDGFVVAASATVGATSYNPLLLPLRAVSAGAAIPTGSDAVIPLGLAEPQPSNLVECVEAVAPGEMLRRKVPWRLRARCWCLSARSCPRLTSAC
jgi:molybdopterin biosynthesis enzyme